MYIKILWLNLKILLIVLLEDLKRKVRVFTPKPKLAKIKKVKITKNRIKGKANFKESIKRTLQDAAMPSFSPSGDTYSTKEPSIPQMIKNIENIIQQYK